MRGIGIALLALFTISAGRIDAQKQAEEEPIPKFKDAAEAAFFFAKRDIMAAATAAEQHLKKHRVESLIEYFESRHGNRLTVRRLCDELLHRYLSQAKWDEAIGLAGRWAVADPEYRDSSLACLVLAYRGKGEVAAAEQSFQQLAARIRQPDFILEAPLPPLLSKLGFQVETPPAPGFLRTLSYRQATSVAEGMAAFSLLLDADGKVQDMQEIEGYRDIRRYFPEYKRDQGLGYRLDEEGRRALMEVQFEPARVDQLAVQHRTVVGIAPGAQEATGRGGGEEKYRLVFEDPAAFAVSRANKDLRLAVAAAAQYLEEHSIESLIQYFETRQGHRLYVQRLCDKLLARYLEQEKWNEVISLAESWAAADPEVRAESLAYQALAYQGSGRADAAEQALQQLKARIRQPDFILNLSSLPSLLTKLGFKTELPVATRAKPGYTRHMGRPETRDRTAGPRRFPGLEDQAGRIAPSPIHFRLGKQGQVLRIRWVHKKLGKTQAIAVAIQLAESSEEDQHFDLNLIVDGKIWGKKRFRAGQLISLEARGAPLPFQIRATEVSRSLISGEIARVSPVGSVEFDFYTADGRLVENKPRMLWLPHPSETDATFAKDGSSTGKYVYTVGRGVSAPVILHQTLPRWTPAAMQAKIEGTVLLQAVLRENGSVDGLRILKSLGYYGLDEAVLEEVANNWRIRPGMRNGKPVSVRTVLEVTLSLR